MTTSILQRTMGHPRVTQFFFNRVAPIYRWLTNNPMWVGSLHEMTRHFPPSQSQLTLLDVGCGHGNSSRRFLELRGDVRVIGADFAANMLLMARRMTSRALPDIQRRASWLQADTLRLPLPDSSVDAITGHSVYYMLGDRDQFLREALRVLRPGGRLILLDPASRPFPIDVLRTSHSLRVKLAVMSWHAVSLMHQRYTLEQMSARLTTAGFARVLTESAVEGYGILSRGEKTYAEGTSTIDRISQVATPTPEPITLQPVESANLPEVTRGRNLFLLVRQTPNRPAWSLQPGEIIRWEAAMLQDQQPNYYLLAFSSLPKAVEFMQAAVKANCLVGINKVAKFDKSVAPSWQTQTLLNPPFATVRESSHFTFSNMTHVIDPSTAVTGEE